MTLSHLLGLSNFKLKEEFLREHGILFGEDVEIERVLATILDMDLRDVAEGPSLPLWAASECQDLRCGKIEGRIMLQIDEIMNASACAKERYEPRKAGFSRCLKLMLTDGHLQCSAFELQPLAELTPEISLGCKVLISDCDIQYGMLCLTPKNFVILGGNVESLQAAKEKILEIWNAPPRGLKISNQDLIERAKHVITNSCRPIEQCRRNSNERLQQDISNNLLQNVSDLSNQPRSGSRIHVVDNHNQSSNLMNTVTDPILNDRRHCDDIDKLQTVGDLLNSNACKENHCRGKIQSIPHQIDLSTRLDSAMKNKKSEKEKKYNCKSVIDAEYPLVSLKQISSLDPGMYLVKASTFNVNFKYSDKATGKILDEFIASVSLEDGEHTLMVKLSKQLVQTLVGNISTSRFGTILNGGEGPQKKAELIEHMKGPYGVIKRIQRFDGIVHLSVKGKATESTSASTTTSAEILALSDIIPTNCAWQLLNRAIKCMKARSST